MPGLSLVLVTPDGDELGGCGVAMGSGRLLCACVRAASPPQGGPIRLWAVTWSHRL